MRNKGLEELRKEAFEKFREDLKNNNIRFPGGLEALMSELNAFDEIMINKRMEELLLDIYFADKTPVYSYDTPTLEGYLCLNKNNSPSTVKSWATPREIVEMAFGARFKEAWEEYLEKKEKIK